MIERATKKRISDMTNEELRSRRVADDHDLIRRAADHMSVYLALWIEKHNEPGADPVKVPRSAMEWLRDFDKWRVVNARPALAESHERTQP